MEARHSIKIKKNFSLTTIYICFYFITKPKVFSVFNTILEIQSQAGLDGLVVQIWSISIREIDGPLENDKIEGHGGYTVFIW